jgi:hypothetical protein
MASSTKLQKKQQALSWKLRMVTGALGNLYPREEFDPSITYGLLRVINDLKVIESAIRCELRNLK